MNCLIWSVSFCLASVLSRAGYVPKRIQLFLIPSYLWRWLRTIDPESRPRWKNNYESIDFLFSVSPPPYAGSSPSLLEIIILWSRLEVIKIGATFCTPPRSQDFIPTQLLLLATYPMVSSRLLTEGMTFIYSPNVAATWSQGHQLTDCHPGLCPRRIAHLQRPNNFSSR